MRCSGAREQRKTVAQVPHDLLQGCRGCCGHRRGSDVLRGWHGGGYGGFCGRQGLPACVRACPTATVRNQARNAGGVRPGGAYAGVTAGTKDIYGGLNGDLPRTQMQCWLDSGWRRASATRGSARGVDHGSGCGAGGEDIDALHLHAARCCRWRRPAESRVREGSA